MDKHGFGIGFSRDWNVVITGSTFHVFFMQMGLDTPDKLD